MSWWTTAERNRCGRQTGRARTVRRETPGKSARCSIMTRTIRKRPDRNINLKTRPSTACSVSHAITGTENRSFRKTVKFQPYRESKKINKRFLRGGVIMYVCASRVPTSTVGFLFGRKKKKKIDNRSSVGSREGMG